MREKHDKWVASSSDDMFSTNYFFDSIEDAIAFGREEYQDDDGFYVGQVDDVKSVDTSINTQFILDIISERAYEQFGDIASDYLYNIKPEHVKELDEALNKVISHWMDFYDYNPSYFTVHNIQYISNEGEEE